MLLEPRSIKDIESTRLFAIIPDHFTTQGKHLWPTYTTDKKHKHFIGFSVTSSRNDIRGLPGKPWSEVLEKLGEIRPKNERSKNLIVQKAVNINGYEGRYMECKNSREYHLQLDFGDEDFSVKIEAHTPLDSLNGIQELREILKTVYCDKDVTLGLLEFPDSLITQKTKNHQRIKGTKLFAIIPQHYTKSEKNDNCFYDNREGYGHNICLSENSYSQSITPQGYKNKSWKENKDWSNKFPTDSHSALFLKKEIQLNEFDGLYIEDFSVLQNGPDFYRFSLKFGHGDFTASISGVAPIDSLNAKNELIEIMKTVYFDKDFYQDELTNASFEFDRSITGLKYVGWNRFKYSDYDPDSEGKRENFISFYPLESADYDKEKVQELLQNGLEFYDHDDFELKNREFGELNINNYDAIVWTAEGVFKNHRTLFYKAIIYDDSNAIKMSGYVDLENREEWLSKFQKTLESVKFK